MNSSDCQSDGSKSESFGYRLGHTFFMLRSSLDRVFCESGFNITTEQWRVLKRIDRNKGTALHAIEKKLHKRQSSLSKLVTRMHNNGLLECRHGQKDKRTKLLFLTSLGERIVDDLNKVAEKNLETALGGIPADQVEQCMQLLRQVEKNILRNVLCGKEDGEKENV